MQTVTTAPIIPYKNPSNRGRKSVRPDNATLAKLYTDHTAKEIAEIYGVSPCTVRGWINFARKGK